MDALPLRSSCNGSLRLEVGEEEAGFQRQEWERALKDADALLGVMGEGDASADRALAASSSQTKRRKRKKRRSLFRCTS